MNNLRIKMYVVDENTGNVLTHINELYIDNNDIDAAAGLLTRRFERLKKQNAN